jgi:hypothetical protein
MMLAIPADAQTPSAWGAFATRARDAARDVGPNVTQSPTGITVENLVLRGGPAVYRIPRTELRGTTLTPAEVSAVLDPASNEAASARILRLAASEIAIPEIRAEQSIGDGQQVTIYRDVLLTGVRDGQVASAVAGGGTFEVSGDAESRGSFKSLTLDKYDLGLTLALFMGPGDAQPGPLKRLYAAFSLEGLSLVDGAGSTTSIARVASGEVLARPTRDGWTNAIAALAKAPPDLNKAEPAERRRVLSVLADVVDSFQVGSLEATGFEFRDPKTTADVGRIARIAYSAAADGRPGEIRLDAFDVTAEDSHVRIGSMAVGGLSLKPFLEAARDMVEVGPEGPDPAQIRKLIPASGTLRLSDIVVDQTKPGGSPLHFAIGAIELAADKPVENIPSDMRIAFRDVSIPVEAAEEGGLQSVADLGYGRIDASVAFGAAWNEPAAELILRDISIRVVGMGSVTATGVLGNVTRDVFSPDTTLAAVALVGATAKSLDIAVENTGLYERIVEREAKRQRRSQDDLRREYGIAAAIGVPAMLGNSAAAKALGTAIARFAAKPGRLLVQAKTKNGAGLGIADMTANPDPTAILGQLDVTATSQ